MTMKYLDKLAIICNFKKVKEKMQQKKVLVKNNTCSSNN